MTTDSPFCEEHVPIIESKKYTHPLRRGWNGARTGRSPARGRLRRTVLLSLVLAACSFSGPGENDEYLIQVGERLVTVGEFNRALEIAKAAYPHNIMQNPEDYRQAQIRLLNQMTEELILLEYARELNIDVSDEEVEQAVAAVKADYPDEQAFEQTLLEYAVSYTEWKNGLRTRLLMEKLIDIELKDQIVITPDEITRYYRENYGSDSMAPGISENSEGFNEMIVNHLRHNKTEKVYRTWIENIQKRYTIKINQKEWEKILSS
ncbi:MAG: hypothetical protein AMJ54_09920 [Deltaproteobacteria bacterium SG8_13]|nr:MAG: hypothetical protein AMJ54_09920 [Deltaproteobacteria bacterium SG8_13]